MSLGPERTAAHLDEVRNALSDRVDASVVDHALYFLKYNEFGLAVETLCDHLCELEVPLTQGEANLLAALVKKYRADPRRIEHVKQLVCR